MVVNIYINLNKYKIKYIINFVENYNWGLGIGDLGLGIGPNPQSPYYLFIF